MKKAKRFGVIILVVVATGFVMPERFVMPVEGANRHSYNQQSFWHYPWGRSGAHKGVDVFSRKGTPVRASTAGLVIYSGTLKIGGNVILILGPKWRLHYYAHLDTNNITGFSIVASGEHIGTVGTSGNALGKPPHLHYSISTLFPYPWRIDTNRQGWKKMFYLDPTTYLNAAS